MNLDYILGEGEEVLGDEFVQAVRSKGRIQLEEARSEWKKVSNLEILRYRVPPLFIFGWAIFERF